MPVCQTRGGFYAYSSDFSFASRRESQRSSFFVMAIWYSSSSSTSWNAPLSSQSWSKATLTSAHSSSRFASHSETLFGVGFVPSSARRSFNAAYASSDASSANCAKISVLGKMSETFFSLLFSFQPVVECRHTRGAKNERPVWRAFIATFFYFHFSDSVHFAVPRKALAASVANRNLNIIEPHALSPIFSAVHPRHTANGHATFSL